MMKYVTKSLRFLVLLYSLMISRNTSAQQWRLIPIVGYTLPQSIKGSKINARVKASDHYGAIVEFEISPIYNIELMYLRQSTETRLRDSLHERIIKTRITWYLMGGVHDMPIKNSKFSGLFGFYFGAVRVSNKKTDRHKTSVGSGLKLGIVYTMTRSLGVRLQTEGLLAFKNFEQVAESTVNSSQLAFTTGIVFSFGRPKKE